MVLHRVEYKDALRDVKILVCSEPIGEDGIWCVAVLLLENFDSDTCLCQGLLESIKFFLCLYSELLISVVDYPFIGQIFLQDHMMHELVVFLTILVLVEFLWADYDDLIGENGQGSLSYLCQRLILVLIIG